jgi:hypothetical protein
MSMATEPKPTLLIEPQTCPEEAQEVAWQKVSQLAGWGVLGFKDKALRLSLPHRVYNLRSRGLAEHGTALREAVDAGGWRFLIVETSAREIVAAVQTWHEEGQWKVSSVRTGTWATATKSALTGGGLPSPATLAYLWCRRTWTAALWLRAEKPEDDKVIPLPWAGWGLMPLGLTSPQEYLEKMRAKKPPEVSLSQPLPG